MASEAIVFSDLFYIAGSLAEDLDFFMNRIITFQLLRDSTCLFYFISEGNRTSEKLKMVNIAAAEKDSKLTLYLKFK